MFDEQRSIVQRLNSEELDKRNIRLYIKRDDLIHGVVSGNKWRKLKYNFLRAKELKNEGVLTFGGAFSNHLIATAAAAEVAGLRSIGIVRGDELTPQSNNTLMACSSYGMELVFVSREEYMLRYEREYHEELIERFPNHLIVPEGGANYYGMIGCQEILKGLEMEPDHIVVAQGTTTTSLGVLMVLSDRQKLDVIPALKGFDSKQEMKRLLMRSGFDSEYIDEVLDKVRVLGDYHFGGYAKASEELINFIREVYWNFNLKTDPVYTGKAFYAMFDRMRSGDYDNSTVLFIHTGGLQGVQPYEKKYGKIFVSKED